MGVYLIELKEGEGPEHNCSFSSSAQPSLSGQGECLPLRVVEERLICQSLVVHTLSL